SEQCGHLNQMVINGSGKSTLMGHFKLKAKRCTDFKKVNYIKGSHIDKNGNQMFFYTDDYGLDSNGAYCIYVFYDGTGPYADFSKVVKVYIRDEMIDKTSGRFFSNGSLE
ncbi:MAG: hypothetical protein KJO00_06515, partial [Bacteroidia bacterium]|nr:hypothetical protein [Bacteroidia bacterium]